MMLDTVPSIINKTFPIPARFRGALPKKIAELSRLLTSERGDRSLSYLSRPEFLSAYLHYFLPWNLCRLCQLLPGLDIKLSTGDKIVDLGSGPLTLVSALWISRPDLHEIPLEFTCIDRCSTALSAGKNFFTAIGGNWKINLVKEEIDIRKAAVMRKQKSYALVCAVNVFNEIYENIERKSYRMNDTERLRRMAENSARLMLAYAQTSSSILTVEPGVPQSGRFIAFLRDAFLELERPPISPCTHTEACPMNGAKKRWCHFAHDASNLRFGEVPKELMRLSKEAKIPKERLVFSYMLTGPMTEKAAKTDREKVRVISDAFALPGGRLARYGCSAKGLVLLTGENSRVKKIAPGDLITPIFTEKCDTKSGALIAEVS